MRLDFYCSSLDDVDYDEGAAFEHRGELKTSCLVDCLGGRNPYAEHFNAWPSDEEEDCSDDEDEAADMPHGGISRHRRRRVLRFTGPRKTVIAPPS